MIRRLASFLPVAIHQILKKRGRLALTVLGIAIGVAAVVGTLSLGEGIRVQAIEAIRSRSDLSFMEVTGGMSGGTFLPLTVPKMRAVNDTPGVRATAPVLLADLSTQRQTHLSMVGIPADGLEGTVLARYEKGRAFRPNTTELVLGAAIGDKLVKYEGLRLNEPRTLLFREYGPSGIPEDIEVPVVPVGILEPRQDRFDDLAFVDPGTLREVTGAEEPADAIYVRAGSPEEVFPVAGRIRAMGLSPSGSFEQIDAVNRLMDTVVLFLSFFAGVSLIVGALMITNIMVISVFERTREIGITMALGASSRDIVALVLLEGLSIGILGGILGDLLGMGIAAALNAAGKPLVLSALGDAFPGIAEGSLAIVTPPMLVLGLIVSVALSLLAGIYPALKASRLNPVEAIRQGA